MVGSNYPPGMSSRDFVRAGIDQPHHHDHEFTSEGTDSPIIEDGAAIFFEECRYVEGEYGQGYSCEETRTYRFEYDCLEVPGGHEVELPEIGDWEDVDEDVQEAVIAVEEALNNGDSRASINVHPDKKHGEVAIDYLGYTLCYRP